APQPRALLKIAAEEFAQAANIKIDFVPDGKPADIKVYQGVPRYDDVSGITMPATREIFLNPKSISNDTNVGDWGYGQIVHELFHAIQGIRDIGYDRDFTDSTSIMSYNYGANSYPYQLRELDKAALVRNFGHSQRALQIAHQPESGSGQHVPPP